MSDFRENIQSANQTGVEFVLVDLDVALTFMDVAESSRDEETIRRNHNNALKVYATVVDLLERLTPTPEERQTIGTKLAVLKARLKSIS